MRKKLNVLCSNNLIEIGDLIAGNLSNHFNIRIRISMITVNRIQKNLIGECPSLCDLWNTITDFT